MTISIQPLPNHTGAELIGLDLAQPLSDAAFDQVHQAYLDYGFILIRRQQHISHRQYTGFASRFDELMAGYPQASGHQQENASYFGKNTAEARYEHPETRIFLLSPM